eukprot:TRINITY_DN3058_c0_g1_i2.p1 TRINITY_DN3058_c0_g1~~TRINITY_DN3058_c0_g1_i2.p1  ORF type:complete len:426 (-),score=57.11 TRINITY_DN3058_c0_g1_i2:210-1388(-)
MSHKQASCAICGVMLPTPAPPSLPHSAIVNCSSCGSGNLFVRVITAQTNCTYCQGIAIQYEEDSLLKCENSSCGSEYVVLSCSKCNINFTIEKKIVQSAPLKIPCSSEKCGNLIKNPLKNKDGRKKDIKSLSSTKKRLTISSEINPPYDIAEVLAKAAKPKRIAILTQYYQDASDERQLEIDMTLTYNLANVFVDEVHVFLEDPTLEEQINIRFNSGKLHLILPEPPKASGSSSPSKPPSSRLSYSTAIDYANNNLTDYLVILANSDIYFDHTLRALYTGNFEDKILALSRYDIKADGSISFNLFTAPISQDAWIFLSPLSRGVSLESLNFSIGLPGCDNRVSYEIRKGGYQLINPCQTVVARHFHTSKRRSYSSKDTVKGNYLPVPPIMER